MQLFEKIRTIALFYDCHVFIVPREDLGRSPTVLSRPYRKFDTSIILSVRVERNKWIDSHLISQYIVSLLCLASQEALCDLRTQLYQEAERVFFS